jgi:VanZ family protein
MLQVTKKSQMFSPGQDFSLSGLSAGQKSKVASIIGLSSQGAVTQWNPNINFPPFSILRANRVYMIQSVLSSGSSFSPYELPIDPAGAPQQDDLIVRSHQFFTYRGAQNFSLAGLSAQVKSKIVLIYGDGVSATANFSTWTPGSLFSPLNSFVPGRHYLVRSVAENFSSYTLGVPAPVVSSSSSSDAIDDFDGAFLSDALLPDIGLLPLEYVEA